MEPERCCIMDVYYLICALAMNGDTEKALQLFSEMIQAGIIRPDEITFVGVLSARSHGGLVEKGRRYFDSMIRIYQIEPKMEHYIYAAASRWEDAKMVRRQMTSMGTNKLPGCSALELCSFD